MKLPHCPGVSQADVYTAAQQFKPRQIAQRYAVPFNHAKTWLSGSEPMPRMLYELLAFRVNCQLPATAGYFANWRGIGGERLDGPVATRQADLIERLVMERDFYKRQWELETRYGLMLRGIVDGTRVFGYLQPYRRPLLLCHQSSHWLRYFGIRLRRRKSLSLAEYAVTRSMIASIDTPPRPSRRRRKECRI